MASEVYSPTELVDRLGAYQAWEVIQAGRKNVYPVWSPKDEADIGKETVEISLAAAITPILEIVEFSEDPRSKGNAYINFGDPEVLSEVSGRFRDKVISIVNRNSFYDRGDTIHLPDTLLSPPESLPQGVVIFSEDPTFYSGYLKKVRDTESSTKGLRHRSAYLRGRNGQDMGPLDRLQITGINGPAVTLRRKPQVHAR